MKKSLLILLWFGATSAQATWYSDGMPYVGLDLGYSATHHAGFDSTGFPGARIYGGYAFNQNLAAELSYTHYDSATQGSTSAKISQHSFDLLGVASMVLMDHFSGHVKAGLSYVDADLEQPGMPSFAARSWRFAFGVGAGYAITPHFLATLDWFHVTGEDGGFSNGRDLPGANLYTLGITYRFLLNEEKHA